jgi:hypothetical protein
VDDIKKIAYKTLNYQALLDIKNSGSFNEDNFIRNFRIAHAFHNLAQYIIDDFEGFNEDDFWGRINALEDQFSLKHYRSIFNDILLR